MSSPTRRHDLDTLRVGAFLLLIIYHLGMFYVPWGWHVKSEHILPALELPMGLLNPWRLTLLFVISGVATRFMGEKMTGGALAGQRSHRLLIPLLFGMAVIVAPQSWAEVVETKGYEGSFLQFWARYLSFDQSFGIILPTYNHLWFVAYLWVYTLLAAAARPLWPALDRLGERLFGGLGLIVVPILLFGLYRATASRLWGETHVVFADAYGHLQYGTAFLIGLMMARLDRAWAWLTDRRMWLAGGLAVVIVVALSLRRWEYPDSAGVLAAVFDFIRAAYAWLVICTLFGFARRHIRSGSPLLTTLTEAVFPFYIIHQTTIVVTGHLLKPFGLPVVAEAGVILAATAASCVATYLLARSSPLLRPLFGLKPEAKTPAQQIAPAAS